MIHPNWEGFLRLIGRARLSALDSQGGDAARWVAAWTAELRDANWKRPIDVVGQFPKSSRRSDGTFLFPVPKHSIEIHVLIAFAEGVALIIAVKFIKSANEN